MKCHASDAPTETITESCAGEEHRERGGLPAWRVKEPPFSASPEREGDSSASEEVETQERKQVQRKDYLGYVLFPRDPG